VLGRKPYQSKSHKSDRVSSGDTLTDLGVDVLDEVSQTMAETLTNQNFNSPDNSIEQPDFDGVEDNNSRINDDVDFRNSDAEKKEERIKKVKKKKKQTKRKRKKQNRMTKGKKRFMDEANLERNEISNVHREGDFSFNDADVDFMSDNENACPSISDELKSVFRFDRADEGFDDNFQSAAMTVHDGFDSVSGSMCKSVTFDDTRNVHYDDPHEWELKSISYDDVKSSWSEEEDDKKDDKIFKVTTEEADKSDNDMEDFIDQSAPASMSVMFEENAPMLDSIFDQESEIEMLHEELRRVQVIKEEEEMMLKEQKQLKQIIEEKAAVINALREKLIKSSGSKSKNVDHIDDFRNPSIDAFDNEKSTLRIESLKSAISTPPTDSTLKGVDDTRDLRDKKNKKQNRKLVKGSNLDNLSSSHTRNTASDVVIENLPKDNLGQQSREKYSKNNHAATNSTNKGKLKGEKTERLRGKKKKKKIIGSKKRKNAVSVGDVLSNLESQYANVSDGESDESDLSDGLDGNIDTYVKIIEDIDESSRKSKFRSSPKFSSKLSSFFSSMPESERAAMILELATETIDEKIELDERRAPDEPFTMKSSDMSPKDSNLIYKNANSNYNGLYSDDAKILSGGSESVVQSCTLHGGGIDNEVSQPSLDYRGDSGLEVESNRTYVSQKTPKVVKMHGQQQDDILQSDYVFPEEFRSTAIQQVVKRKH
jgi:hypothetical protein